MEIAGTGEKTPTQEGSYCTSVLLLIVINLWPVYMQVGDPRQVR